MAGSAMTFTYDEIGPIHKVAIAWTSDDTTGAVTGTTKKLIGTIRKIQTDPGTAAPTANYDIVITDEQSVNVLGNSADDLADRHTSTTEEITPFMLDYAGTPLAQSVFPTVCDQLTVAVSNAGNSKNGTIYIYLHREA